MLPEDIQRLHSRYKVEGSGPISATEGTCFLRAIEEHRPTSFLELGTSSGLSTGLIANMLHDNGGERLVSVDVSARYYRDESLPTGFLVPELYQGDRVTVDLRSPLTSIGVAGWDETFEMGFVDGNHGHPWPVIDLLCLAPRLTGPRILFQHDLNLFRKQPISGGQPFPHGIGPKFLFDQFPDSHRHRYSANGGNLFSVSLDMPQEQLEAIAIEAFALPWTTLRRMGGHRLEAFRDVLRSNYSPAVLDAFDHHRERFALPAKAA